jgi:hypothetical protein
MTSSNDADRVRTIAAIAYRDCDEAVAIISFLETGNTKEAVQAFAPLEGHLVVLIRKAMLQRLLMTMMRLHDNPGADRETLVRAFQLLAQPDAYCAMAERGDKVRLDAAIEAWRPLSAEAALKKIRAVRNYEAAHSIPSKAGAPRPIINEFSEIANRTIAVVEDLAAGTGVVTVSFSGTRAIWDKRSAAYWSRLQRKSC